REALLHQIRRHWHSHRAYADERNPRHDDLLLLGCPRTKAHAPSGTVLRDLACADRALSRAGPEPFSYTARAMLTGLLLIGLASISWGTTGATMTLIMRDSAIGALLVGWVRLAVAAVCLALAVVVTGRIGGRRTVALRAAPSEHWSNTHSSYALLGLAMA